MSANGNAYAAHKALENEAAVAKILLLRAATIDELAAAAGMHRDGIRKRVFVRLRERGLPVVEVAREKRVSGRGAYAVYYRIVMPEGRVCAHEDCITRLRKTNPSRHCELHGGGFLDLGVPEYVHVTRERSANVCPGYKRDRHRTTDFSPSNSLCRPCAAHYHRDRRARIARQAAEGEGVAV